VIYTLLSEMVALAGGAVTGNVTLALQPVGPVIVYVKQLDGVAPQPGVESSMKQVDVQFRPSVLVAQVGSTVHFPNMDKVWHSVHSPSHGNAFDLGLYRSGRNQSVQLKSPGEVQLSCHIHPQMSATILVLQNPLFAEVRPDGSFTLPDVPAGSYQLVAWERAHSPITRDILVVDGQATKVDYTLSYNPSALDHLHKSNDMYGRYQ
jgi:plastocyanin